MIYFELPTGKTVALTLEKYLNLTDEDIQDLIADDRGTVINDPFKDAYAPLYLETEEKEVNIDYVPPEELEQIKKEIKKHL